MEQLRYSSTPTKNIVPVVSALLQRCKATTEFPERRKKNEGMLQRAAINSSSLSDVPSLVHEVLRSPGQPLDAMTRAQMEPRFAQDFSGVKLHTDERAAKSAQAVDALAYTVGRDIVFAEGQYFPRTAKGQRLVAHELTHVVQQHSHINENPWRHNLAINEHDDAFEQEANAMAKHVMAGTSPKEESLAKGRLAIQRDTPASDSEKKAQGKEEPADAIVDGLKTVADQAMDNNPKVKKVILAPIEDKLKGKWDRLSTGEKAATIGWGAATLGLAGGTMLSDPGGRKQLEGTNLAAPLTLIPFMPLSSFKYTLPSGDGPDKRQFRFETGFNADDLINLHTKTRGLPPMSLRVNMQWGYDPSNGKLSIFSGDASLGIVPGLSLSGGTYKDVLRPPQTTLGPEGQMTQIKKSIPEFGKPQPIPDVRIMLNVDLMKFKPSDFVRQIKGMF
jgi:hypothetical protein